MSKRQKFIYNNQIIYEWEQSLSEIDIYIKPPNVYKY